MWSANSAPSTKAWTAFVTLQPDIVMTDLGLPGRSGIELLSEIKRLSPLTRKLVLTAHENEEYIRAALNAGADGYVLKDANSAELMLGIRTVSVGQQFLCKAIASKILSGYLSGDQQPRLRDGDAVHYRARTRGSDPHRPRQFQ